MEKQKKLPRAGKILCFSALLAACIAFLAADGLWLLNAGSPGPTTLTVPDLVGTRFTEGSTPGTSETDPWFHTSVTYAYHPEKPTRTVISQDPPAGALRKAVFKSAPCPLHLVVSMGPRKVKIPDMIGWDVQNARLVLEGMELTVVTSHVTTWGHHAENQAADRVMKISPAPGTIVSDNTAVTLSISSPLRKDTVPCPDVVGLTLAEASARLRNAGFRVGFVYKNNLSDNVFSRFKPHICPRATQVLWQDRIPGTYLPQNTEITLTVSPSEHSPSC